MVKENYLRGILFLALCSIVSISQAQVSSFFVQPFDVDPNYSSQEDSSTIVINSSTQQNKLYVFLGGTNSSSSTSYIQLGLHAANLGFDFINLSYPNDVAAASLANANDTLVFDHYREELCFGTQVSSAVSIDSLNAISTRILKLIQYLNLTNPSHNWGQYLISGSSVDWSKIILGGHSQGSGHAAYIAKQKSVDRVLMFSGPNDFSDQFSNAANWLRQPGITDVNRHFSYLNLNDEVVDFSKQFVNITGLGMLVNDDSTLVDNKNTPFENSRVLYTKQMPNLFSNHSAPVIFNALNTEVWTYMLTSPIVTSINDQREELNFTIYPNPSNSFIQVKTATNSTGKYYFLKSIKGEVVMFDKIIKQDFRINLEDLVKGVYFLELDGHIIKLLRN